MSRYYVIYEVMLTVDSESEYGAKRIAENAIECMDGFDGFLAAPEYRLHLRPWTKKASGGAAE